MNSSTLIASALRILSTNDTSFFAELNHQLCKTSISEFSAIPFQPPGVVGARSPSIGPPPRFHGDGACARRRAKAACDWIGASDIPQSATSDGRRLPSACLDCIRFHALLRCCECEMQNAPDTHPNMTMMGVSKGHLKQASSTAIRRVWTVLCRSFHSCSLVQAAPLRLARPSFHWPQVPHLPSVPSKSPEDKRPAALRSSFCCPGIPRQRTSHGNPSSLSVFRLPAARIRGAEGIGRGGCATPAPPAES